MYTVASHGPTILSRLTPRHLLTILSDMGYKDMNVTYGSGCNEQSRVEHSSINKGLSNIYNEQDVWITLPKENVNINVKVNVEVNVNDNVGKNVGNYVDEVVKTSLNVTTTTSPPVPNHILDSIITSLNIDSNDTKLRSQLLQGFLKSTLVLPPPIPISTSLRQAMTMGIDTATTAGTPSNSSSIKMSDNSSSSGSTSSTSSTRSSDTTVDTSTPGTVYRDVILTPGLAYGSAFVSSIVYGPTSEASLPNIPRPDANIQQILKRRGIVDGVDRSTVANSSGLSGGHGKTIPTAPISHSGGGGDVLTNQSNIKSGINVMKKQPSSSNMNMNMNMNTKQQQKGISQGQGKGSGAFTQGGKGQNEKANQGAGYKGGGKQTGGEESRDDSSGGSALRIPPGSTSSSVGIGGGSIGASGKRKQEGTEEPPTKRMKHG